jgi:hypothetical protein
MLKNLSLKNFKVSSILVAALLATAALPSAAAADPAASASQMATKWVHMKGIVAEVGVPLRKLVGVKVGVVENSKWRTTVKADGTYDLTVPAQTTVTRYFDLGRDTADPADDHLRIYSPTIKTTKTGVPRWSSLIVALPSLALARELANLVKIDIADGKDAPQDCVVVSLTAIKAFEKMTFAQVVARNNLVGVPGAKPTISPAKGINPLFIGGNLMPAPAQTTTGTSGLAIYIGVTPGTYKFSATKAGNKFSTMTAVCKPGRVIFGEVGQL